MLALLAPIITGTATFALGALDVGPVDGFTPGGHFDVGISLHDVRLQAELGAGLWAKEQPTSAIPESGSYRRIGGALRYYFANLDVAPDEKSRLRLFLEGGVGRQTIRSASVDIERPDLAIGFGMAQQARVG